MSRLRYTASCCILIYISSCNLKKTKTFIYLINNILSSELCICYRVTASSQQRAWGAPHNHLLRWTLVIHDMKYTISFISFVSAGWMLNVWTHAIPTIRLYIPIGFHFMLLYGDETLQCVLLFFSTALVYFSKHIWRSQKLKKMHFLKQLMHAEKHYS